MIDLLSWIIPLSLGLLGPVWLGWTVYLLVESLLDHHADRIREEE